MGSLFDYLNWRGDLSFLQSEINEVDSLIFSLLSYIDFGGIVPSSHESGEAVPLRTATNSFFARNPDRKKMTMGVMVPKEIFTLLRAIKDTNRFRNVQVKAHVSILDLAQEMQFSATTFLLDDGTALVAYRGTDDTIVGWKENFNMSFMDSIPAQRQAVRYLDEAALHFEGDFRLTGHSKGGNLAVYAAIHSRESVRKRLLRVWSNDGPGFCRKILENPTYIEIRPIVRTIVPESSVVGMLLEHEEHYTVIKSRRRGVFQHDGLTWEVMGDSFVHLKTVSGKATRTDRTLNQFIRSMSMEQREEFAEALYRLLSVNNSLTLTDLVSARRKWIAMGKSIDPKVYRTITQTLTELINMSARNFVDDVVHKRKQ